MPIILPEEFFQGVYDILEEHTNASSWHRDDFIKYFMNGGDQFYFCGDLGKGGSFNNQGGRLYVMCNPEDETDENYSIIEKVNEILEEMLVDYMANFRKKKKNEQT
jgi:hypothetical protein